MREAGFSLRPTAHNFKDLSGKRFGRLLVIKRLPDSISEAGNRTVCWACRCDCGKEVSVRVNNLRTCSRSCGCLHRELASKAKTIHGYSRIGKRSPEYISWCGMKHRCYDKNDKRYSDYGGRGIVMCESWRASFTNFLSAVGFRPSPQHSIDRYPNNNGNYEPGNVRWATRKEQNRNQRTNRWINFKGRTKVLAEWAEITGINEYILRRRLKSGRPLL